MIKYELRKLYKTKRLSLNKEIRIIYDTQILEQFKSIIPKVPITILTFAPIEKWNEPNVNIITDYLQNRGLISTLAFPKIHADNNSFDAIVVNNDTTFDVHDFDINEPKNGNIISPKEIDIVLVPLLAFDKNGYRVGYGKGMYDKYLQECRKDVLKIGISYFPPIESISDTDKYDIPLDYCVTPEKCYKFGAVH